MLEVLQFIFSGFWVFVGSLMLVSVTLQGLAAIISAIRG